MCFFLDWQIKKLDAWIMVYPINTSRIGFTFAFEVTLNDLLIASRRLRSYGITPLSFFGQETDEPSVICWMPAAFIYFRDPDGHLIEHLATLNESPKPTLGVIPYSEWSDNRENR